MASDPLTPAVLDEGARLFDDDAQWFEAYGWAVHHAPALIAAARELAELKAACGCGREIAIYRQCERCRR